MTKDEIIAECAATISWLRNKIIDEIICEAGPTSWSEDLKEVKKTIEHCLDFIQKGP